jgi:ABC-2 type transport system ATP-binding protein
MAPGAVVAARDLTKTYGRTRGVVELDFEVEPGEVFGYLGPNGAGKTTTIRTMLDFISPTSGRIEVFGLDRGATRSRSTGGSATCPASSRSTSA